MLFREMPPRQKVPVSEFVGSQEVQKTKPSEVVHRLSVVNGTPQNPRQQEDATNELIRTFETRDDDVFVCTFVKSGTTWVQQIITLLLNGGTQGEKPYVEAVPWLESLIFHFEEHEPAEIRDLEAKNWTLDKLKSTPDRRFMKSHAKLKDLPAGSAKGLKVIYVARNPKDVCVSLFHHIKIKRPETFTGNMSDLIRTFLEGRHVNGSWFDHVLEWWEAANADPEHVMFLHYEAMLAKPEEHVQRIAEFTGIEHTPETLAKTVENSSLSAMKENGKANLYPGHLRKGAAGAWRDAFTVQESESFDKIYKEQMAGSGLRMDFGQGLVM